MRYSEEKPVPCKLVVPRPQGTHEAWFRRVMAKSTPEERRGGILLAGGTSPVDLQVRHAQATLRFDRLPSFWSHAAIVLSWPDDAEPQDVVGVEVSLKRGADGALPERNGATLFRLSDYMATSLWKNVAFAVVKRRPSEAKPDADGLKAFKDELEKAALAPMSERTRYPLYSWLGVWSRFAIAGGKNPLDEGVPHPGAAFCEYVYGQAGVDLSPGATAPNVCPEILWNTARFWSKRLAQAGGIEMCASGWQEEGPGRNPSGRLADDFRSLIADSARGRGKGGKGGKA